ncbi:hypothetical protein [Saliterribacillus persicus]|uniref:Uncharacterized protein n=1 Tax=Saliterribacillus persicus TaxID=930114 RepID=A0A368XGG1_9BACI|nr:hypothetical protein [Saliterribacillus persicus]RCW67053.1 hypothetical protein DFR57_108153 [Saliterribacillus persicus]
MTEQKKRDYKAIHWFSYIIIIISLLVNTYAISNGIPRPILGFSYLSFLGVIIGLVIFILFSYKLKKLKSRK